MTLLAIQTHAAISDFLPLMWPHFKRAGLPIAGCSRSNAPTTWPEPVPVVTHGEDVFQRWCEHQSKTLLNDRELGTMEKLLSDERFSAYSDFCLTDWSVVFTRPLPPFPGGLLLHLTGHGQPDRGFKAKQFFHQPWWFDRPTGHALCKMGRQLMANGEHEHGSSDFLLGLAIDRLGIQWTEVPAFSCGRLDHPNLVAAAREAMKGDAWWIHGVKEPGQLAALMAP